jgi:3-oxoacyl-[acyl-carrier-protein] synthase III
VTPLRLDSQAMAIRGVVTAVPQARYSNADLGPDAAQAAKITGVLERRRAQEHHSTESLGFLAADRLLSSLSWNRGSVDLLVYVTQTPGQEVPSPAYAVHARLGLPASCQVVQVNWSCAGYVYALWLASRMADRRALVIVGDCFTRKTDPGDRATFPLFGDAVSATAVEVGSSLCSNVDFVLGNDGNRNQLLSVPEGGRWLDMDGPSVFAFTLAAVPPVLQALVRDSRPDAFLFHQANAFILSHLDKKLKLRETYGLDSLPVNVERWGNTSSASIPLLLCDMPGSRLKEALLAMVGFGAGWACAGAMVRMDWFEGAEIMEVP